jgi:hypothetical protein
MATVFDIANFFITAENKREQGSMTNLRLNKILYFAQIISLLENGRPLFLDDFEAWDLGPVIPSVYRKYKAYENTPIQEPETIDYSAFTAEEIRLLFDVYSLYENGNWVRNRYYEGILMGDCWCDPNRVGSRPLLGRETSHITVRTVRYTAIPNFTSHSHNSHLATGIPLEQ